MRAKYRLGLASMLTLLVSVGTLGLQGTASAQASPGTAGSAKAPGTGLTKQIEWDRPVTLVPSRAPAAKGAVTPSTISAPTCYMNAAYPVKYGGVDTWSDSSLSQYGVTASVQYYFCRRYPGDPIGWNFAKGWVTITSGDTWSVTYGEGWSRTWDGASIHLNGCNGCWSAPNYFGSGEYQVTYAHNYSFPVVYDYSTTGPGDGTWSAQFWVAVQRYDSQLGPWGPVYTLSAISPTF